MPSWTKLMDLKQKTFSRGTLIKFPAKYPFEEEVVMMIAESPDKQGLCLITITGYKAGINCYQQFPKLNSHIEVSAIWLIENWHKWVWPTGNINDVFIRHNLKADDL